MGFQKNKKNFKQNDAPKVTRARLPKGKEVMGVIEERLGGNKMRVNCFDSKQRICRVPGRLKRKLWLRPEDIIIIEPWELDDKKGDVIFKYPKNQIIWLRNNGYLENEETEF